MRKSTIRVACILASMQCVWGQARITGVANAASFQSGLPSGGSLATLFCTGVTGLPTGTFIASSSPLPYVLGQVSVIVNNGPAPLLAVVISPASQGESIQVNFQVPMERNASLFGTANGNYSGSLVVGFWDSALLGILSSLSLQPFPAPLPWGAFISDANGYVIAQHAADNSLVTTQNPAFPGETIIAYADDFFPVLPSPPIGLPAPAQPLLQLGSVKFPFGSAFYAEFPGTALYLQGYPSSICAIPMNGDCSIANSTPLKVTFAGVAPGQIGVEQINFVVPASQVPGDWPLFFNFAAGNGFGESSPYVKLPVR